MIVPERRSITVQNLDHGNIPIPTASRLGTLIATGAIKGINLATGVMPADIATQAENMFSNLKTVIEAAGGSMDTVVRVSLYFKDVEDRRGVNPAWEKHFPDPDRRPARLTLKNDLPGTMLVNCEAIAFAIDG